MPSLLHLDSSADPSTSRTRALTAAFADAWRGRGEEYTVIRRDLHIDPLPHLVTPAQHWPERLRGGHPVPPEAEALQHAVLAELLAADAVVIGAPMYNYGIPSTLKTWIDLIHVPGVTTPFDVPTQPLAGRPAVIVMARGGIDDPEERVFVTGQLTRILGEALGMEVSVVTTGRTLADSIPDLDKELAAREFADAVAVAEQIARTI